MRYLLLLMMLSVGSAATAQNLQERGEVRRGYKAFLDEDYEKAAAHFERAVEHAPGSFEARYNLGSAKFKSGLVEQAAMAQQQQGGEAMQGAGEVKGLADGEKLFAELAADSLLNNTDRAHAYFNLGNSQLSQQKLEEALESYKNSMRMDPDDQEAKYNYAYTKALMEQQQQNEDQNQDQNEDQQDENQDENQDQQNQDQDQNGDENEDQNQDQEDQEQDQQEGEGEPQPQEGQISEQEQQQMLDAIQAQEDKTQEDLKERARGVVVPGAKNW